MSSKRGKWGVRGCPQKVVIYALVYTFFMFAKITGVVVVVAAAVLVVVEGRAVLENNGYSEFVVAISPDVPQAYN